MVQASLSWIGFVILWVLPIPVFSITLQGAGSSLAERLYLKVATAYNFVEPNVSVVYCGLGSGRGLCRLKGTCDASDTAEPHAVDFSAADSVLTDAEYEQFPDLQMYPALTAAVVPIYNLGGGTGLVLSIQVLAAIFRGAITSWDALEIQAMNPKFYDWQVPPGQPIELVVRADSSGTTEIFKKTLADLDPLFAAQMGRSAGPTWPNVNVTKCDSTQGVLSYVMMNPYTIGYASLGEAMTNALPMVTLQKAPGIFVEPSVTSAEFAMLQAGNKVGGNGNNAGHLTADLQNAEGPNAWPMVGFTYLVMRKSTLRQGATCDNMRETVKFWHWFWTSESMAALARQSGFSPLPSVVRDLVVDRLVRDVQCGGRQTWSDDWQQPITGQGPDAVADFMELLSNIYNSQVPENVLVFQSTSTNSAVNVSKDLATSMFVITSTPPSPPLENGVTLLLGAVGTVAITQLHVTLDGPTLAMILDGEITNWLDPRILKLNPGGILDKAGRFLSASQSIVLLTSPWASNPSVTAMMQSYWQPFKGRAVVAAPKFATEDILRSAIMGCSYCLAVTSYTGHFPTGLYLVPFWRINSVPTPVSYQAIQACASADVYDAKRNAFDLMRSQSPQCYPLSTLLFVSVKKADCSTIIEDNLLAARRFVQWLFTDISVDRAMQDAFLAPLRSVNKHVIAHNSGALDAINCKSDVVNVGPIIGTVVGVGLFSLLFISGIYIFQIRGRRDNAAAPKDESRPFCVLFTDIQSSTHLWATIPVNMATALDIHHNLMRQLIQRHKLYEVKTIGDSFMCTTSDPQRAVAFALDLQQQLYQIDWGTELLDHVYLNDEDGAFEKHLSSPIPRKKNLCLPVWNGLRVRVGIHYGMGNIKKDPVSKGYDYYGTAVNTAARIETILHGGQVGISKEVFELLDRNSPAFLHTDLGVHTLRGLTEPIHLYQLLPAGILENRTFPALRLERAEHIADGVHDSDDTGLSERRTTQSTITPIVFQAEVHPLVIKGQLTAPELRKYYATAMATLTTLFSVQSIKFTETTLKGLCSRLKVRYSGSQGIPLQHTLHVLVMRVLPAIAAQWDRRFSFRSNTNSTIVNSICSPSPMGSSAPSYPRYGLASPRASTAPCLPHAVPSRQGSPLVFEPCIHEHSFV